MQKYKSNLQDAVGRAIANAQVTVLNIDGSVAELFSDNGVTPLANPLVTNKQGEFQFYAENGRYSLSIRAPGYTGESDIDVVLMFDPDDFLSDVIGPDVAAAEQAAQDAEAARDEAVAVVNGLGGLEGAIAEAEAAAANAGNEADRAQTEANRSDTEADRAKDEADRAGTEADRAEMAADAAALNAGIYPDTTDGLAATTDGQYFSVPSDDEAGYLDLYRNDSGDATKVDTYPNKAVVLAEVAERTFLVHREDVLVVPDYGVPIAEVQVDADDRVTYMRLLAGPIYREAAEGLVRVLDSTDMDIETSDAVLVPTVRSALSSVWLDNDDRVQRAVTARGEWRATDSGLSLPASSSDPDTFDLVIYGATLSGLCAGIAAAREGRRVAILEPTEFVGGAIVAGLAYQDFTSPNAFTRSCLRGIAREYYSMLAPYNLKRALDGGQTNQSILNEFRGGPQFRLHPADAREVFEELISRYGIHVRLGVRIDAARHVWRRGRRIGGIVTPAGVVKGRYFIDASYEGDLIKHSGAGYRYGRESETEYNEQGAGFRRANARTVAGYSTNTFYPVGSDPGTPHGGADDGCMGFCFRGVMTQEAERLPWPMPDGYNRTDFLPLAEQIDAYGETAFVTNVPGFDSGAGGRFHAYDLRNNQRVNWNSNPWLSLDLIGKTKNYRDGNWAARDAFVAELEYWNKGLFYFLANDSAVPEGIRTKANSWGLPVDEFQDSPLGVGWPHWPYIRAGIRLRGAETLTGVHQLAGQTWPTRVISWVYQQDSKACTAWAHPADPTAVLEEGYIPAPDLTAPYEIPAEVMFEAEGGLENLLVSNLISCTNVAWTAYRLEPALGMMGHAAGLLAAQCMDRADAAVQDYDYNDLRLRLNAGGFNW